MRIRRIVYVTGSLTSIILNGCGVSQKELDDRVSAIHSRVDHLTDFEKQQLARIRVTDGTDKLSSSQRRRTWKALQSVYGHEVQHKPLTEEEFQQIMSKFHGNVNVGPERYREISGGDPKIRARVGALASALTRADVAS